jgi:hypothetical protein
LLFRIILEKTILLGQHLRQAENEGIKVNHMDLFGSEENVRTRMDLVKFICLLRDDLKADPSSWENDTLDSFLDAMASWVEGMNQLYKNLGMEFSEDQPWNLFA